MVEHSPVSSKEPDELLADPVLGWANEIAGDERYRREPLHSHFIQLRDRYYALLKRFLKIAKISDGFQLSLKEVNALLDAAAHTDYLTGLPNRRDILEKIESEIGRAKRHGSSYSILMADIDHFKELNDAHGHVAGDRILKSVAECLRRSLRVEDHCARWGGEEFLICLPQTMLSKALLVAEKLRANIERTYVKLDGEDVGVTVSLGVSCHDGDVHIDNVIKAADSAMFDAKRAGRNRVEAAHEPPARSQS